MKEFETQLLREKFLIIDPAQDDEGYEPVKALSNRIEIILPNVRGDDETLIIRAQNMHTCVRYAAQIVQSYDQSGPLIGRINDNFWKDKWEKVESGYERAFNPRRWLAVYHAGVPVFEVNDHHPFLDVIEHHCFASRDDYEKAIPAAAAIFKAAGKNVRIEHDSNYAFTLNIEENAARIGSILRNPSHTSTFSFGMIANKEQKTLNIGHAMQTAAAFLEGVELAFLSGMNDEKIRLGFISSASQALKQTNQAKARLGVLASEITYIEDIYTVNYRVDKPSFAEIEQDAGRLARKILAPEDAEFDDLKSPSTKPKPRSKSARNK
ncbi:MAG: hypothetical protein ACRBCT_04725 [Alphaproteobacteria bacterium]